MQTLQLLREGKLSGARRLDLSCGLTEFPREIFELADTLEILNLSGNALTSLPDDFNRLHRCRILFCSNNQFKEYPEVLGQASQLTMIGFKSNQIAHIPASAFNPALRWLILTDNRLTSLPEQIGNCQTLQKLMLSGNLLTQLPVSLQHCQALELIRIASNRLNRLPECVLKLPKLAWLAYAGNPFTGTENMAELNGESWKNIAWDQLEVHEKLGEGASGTIYRSTWRIPVHTTEDSGSGTESPDAGINTVEHKVIPTALKLFKASINSDGMPEHEMLACRRAGLHPHLIPVFGEISNHPSHEKAMLMGLIDEQYSNLAGPPSLQSCTRDIYADDFQISLRHMLRLLYAIAQAAAHLHARGILHGDLYAHNILKNQSYDCLLGDFGAASCYPVQLKNLQNNSGSSTTATLEQIEVRAFGCLIEELLEHCDELRQKFDDPWILQLQEMKENCLQESIYCRPQFSALEEQLECMKSALS